MIYLNTINHKLILEKINFFEISKGRREYITDDFNKKRLKIVLKSLVQMY